MTCCSSLFVFITERRPRTRPPSSRVEWKWLNHSSREALQKKYCPALSLSKLEFACNVRFTRRLDSSISALVGIYVRIIGKLEFACEFQDAQQEAAVGPDHKSLPRPRDGHVQSAVVRQETQRAALVRTHLVIFSGHFRLNCNRRGGGSLSEKMTIWVY